MNVRRRISRFTCRDRNLPDPFGRRPLAFKQDEIIGVKLEQIEKKVGKTATR